MNILLVCKANYCRSPVGHKILQSKNIPNTQINSAGIIDFTASSMHKDSIEFLRNIGIKDLIHFPKLISSDMINKSDYILVFDYDIYEYFLHNHQSSLKKLKMFNFLDLHKETDDPISFDKKTYNKIMSNIHHLSDLIADWIFLHNEKDI